MTIFQDLILKVVFSLMIAFLAIFDYFRQTNEKNDKIEQYTNCLLICLPLYLLIGFFFGLINGFRWDFLHRLIPIILVVCFVWICYDGILILAMPWLRKKFSAFTCAYLWVLPNFLYAFTNIRFEDFHHWITISIPRRMLIIFFIIWFLGFVLTAGKMIWNHHCFAKNLMKDAKLVTDSVTLVQFMRWKHHFDKENKIRLYRSPATKTPVSLGSNLPNMKVILPEKEYSQQELEWIFRHEITHLRKNDCALKFFLAMTNAIFWFIPFTWIASKRLAEDQELSCDEMVLAGCDREKRKEYANLLLNTAGDSRGFSTCLSSTGESMRYRLKHIVNPEFHGGIHNILLITICIVIMFTFVFSIEINVIL
ncbi:MAG: M56 family metallopeptidase [Eubacteriales bacterium]|nr:M56 family metallopeptidase [Eubacteriales bacterium]